MAKKDIASLMSGLMGDNKPAETPAVPDAAEAKNENPEVPQKRKVGRPRKSEFGAASNEIRATFIVDADLIRKVKYISLAESSLLKDVISSALQSYVDAWEAENGKIKLPKKK